MADWHRAAALAADKSNQIGLRFSAQEIGEELKKDMNFRMKLMLEYARQLPAIGALSIEKFINLLRFNYITSLSLLINKLFINDE